MLPPSSFRDDSVLRAKEACLPYRCQHRPTLSTRALPRACHSYPFRLGQNFMDQLTLIFDVVGSPKPHEVAHIRNSQARRFLETMQGRVKVR